MSVDISVSITEDIVDIIATPTVNIVNVTNSASIDPGLYDLSEFTNTSLNPFVRASNLSSYVPSTRSILTTSPLVGGGDLSANRTISIPQATSSVNGFLSSTDWTTFNNKQNALGFTPVPETRTLTINGVTQDLSADSSWTISTGLTVGTTPISSGTIGRVLFQGTGNVLQQSSSLFWDSTNNRLGIGTATPTRTIEVNGETMLRDALTLSNAGDRGRVTWGGGYFSFQALGSEGLSFMLPSNARVISIPNATGNVLINTTTDAGFRLDVNGTARVSGNLTLGSEIFGTTNTYFNGPTVNTGTLWLRFAGVNSSNNFTATGTVQGANVTASSANSAITVTGSGIPGLIVANTTSSATWRIEGHRTTSGALEFKNDITNPVLNLFSTRNVGIGTFTDAGFRLDVNGSVRFGTSTYMKFEAVGQPRLIWGETADRLSIQRSSGNQFIFAQGNGTLSNFARIGSGDVEFSETTNYSGTNPSVILALNSTSKGFLPPRGSNAQMLAIASPAKGLIFFDNTNNKLNCYDGTTWQPCW